MAKESSPGLSADATDTLPALGLGCVTFGREIDRAAAFAMMDHAVARGITTFDTAAAYGQGVSETIVGEWLAAGGNRQFVRVATKLLPPYSAAGITSGFAASLGRLKLDRVDTLFLHQWHDTAIEPDTLRALDALVRSGRVRHLGASNFSASQLETALGRQVRLAVTPFTALQNIHNVAVRGIDDETRALCRARGITTVTYSPLGAGFLTGKHEAGVQPGSRFELIPGHQRIYFNDEARRRLTRLQEISAHSGVSIVQLALAWALHQPGVDVVLVGGRTTAQIDQAVEARQFADMEVLRELDAG